jgi:DNA-binding PadR family transcriptional regulator
MERAGYLTRQDRVIGGKVRKYYSITDPGREALTDARTKVVELVDEVLEGYGPTRQPQPPAASEGNDTGVHST